MFDFDLASEIAEDFLSRLSTVCERTMVVGSLRRKRSCVRDIDIIVQPRFIELRQESLHGPPRLESVLDMKLTELYRKGLFTIEYNGPQCRRFMMQVDHEHLPVDLYIGTDDSWWTLCLIRTGSRSHNIAMACRAMQQGMRLKSDGSALLSPEGTPLPISSEEEIFQILKTPYKRPEERE